MRIGLVTLCRYNYGSALQCFSTQEYLKENYGECILIEKKREGRFKSYLQTLVALSYRCIINPTSIKSIISQFRAQRAGSLTVSPNSLREIERFILCNINKKSYKYKELIAAAKTDEYKYFFTGSDQVWNGARIFGYDMYFLRFAPPKKRVAWAPSFGSDEIALYNKKLYSEYMSHFQALSVREKSGEKIVEQLTGKAVETLCDPVTLFTGDQWRALYNNRTSFTIDYKYICLFFIDTISKEALDFTRKVSQKSGLKIISFGYRNDSYNALENYIHYDGSPFDFLKCIDNAEMVITDSYHATVFSLLFHSEFYSFTRKYTHNQNQSTRLTDLMKNVQAIDRFDPSGMMQAFNFSVSDVYFQIERDKADQYLKRILGNKKEKESSQIELYKTPAECCGCGACVDICTKNAISLFCSDRGYLPTVDSNICIGCKKCLRVCGLKSDEDKKDVTRQAFIGKCKNEETTAKSASGGLFATIAQSFLQQGGVVYGAALYIDNGICDCRHIRIDKTEDLHFILNSKYVQSRTDGIYRAVKNDLKQGKRVLFSGTSCQVASLKAYLEENEKTNLFTIDLICHGVPSIDLLQKYVDYIQKKMNATIVDIRFRIKNRNISSFAPFIMAFDLEGRFGKKTEYIPLRESSYYRLFLNFAAYRYSCYNCKFATINKPADITLGDYFITDSQSSFIKTLPLDKKEYYSCVIIQTNKGASLIQGTNLELYEIPVEDAIIDHINLQYASIPTSQCEKLLGIFDKEGFAGLQRYIDRHNNFVDCIKKARSVFARHI